ncbi:unnamed protein product [Chrysodeixis includens]|uniref:Uncharacterized protein n=1 Tax=Chrysodeixis includens TaxID=689277 RepID=A0A9P0C1B2_CHRIL|nr:unnamed protein product [Chrysodeixis includens]
MDKPKTHLVKSKSSNSATKSESCKHNKKSRSNGGFLAEYQPLSSKKRGVYVEKKPTKISINEQPDLSPDEISKKPSTPRVIPRPGRKRFLDSVLTILSQSTTGTQYPDRDDSERLKIFDKTKTKLKKKKEEEAIQGDSIITASSSKKKHRYRSKVLSHNRDFEQLVVLRSTKEITHTPSIISSKTNSLKEPENIRWADFLPPLVKKENSEHFNTIDDNRSLQGKNKDSGPSLVLDKDPVTLVAEGPKKEEKKLYNFFVDLLETTFNVYNVKTDFIPPPNSSVNSSKVTFEIDESVAKKLNIQKVKDCAECSEEKLCSTVSKHVYCIKPDDNEVWDNIVKQNEQSASSKRSRPPSPTRSLKKKRRLHSESFDTKKFKPVPITASLTIPNKKKLLRKDKKKTFINMLKEQLKMEECVFEEPQNFYQALKVIARNKRRQKSIHFKSSEGDVHVCQFKRRGILSSNPLNCPKSSKKSYRPDSEFMKPIRSFNNSDISSSTRKKTLTMTEISEHDLEPSQHSLEVYGFDYELNTHKRCRPDFGSSGSIYNKDYFLESLLKYSDSGTSSMQSPSRISYLSERHGLRSLNRLLAK